MRLLRELLTFLIYLVAAAFVIVATTGSAEEPQDGPWRGYARVCVVRDAVVFGCTSLRSPDLFPSYGQCQDTLLARMVVMRRTISERLPDGRLLATTSCRPEAHGPPPERGEYEA